MRKAIFWSLFIILASPLIIKGPQNSKSPHSLIFRNRQSKTINFFQVQFREGESDSLNSNSTDVDSANSTEVNNEYHDDNATNIENVTNSDNETESEVNYDILDDENYGEEVKDIKNAINQSGNRTVAKINEESEKIKEKIDNVTKALEIKLNNFTERIINKSKELDKLMLFNELKLLKLAVDVLKSQVNEIISEIFRLKNLLVKLLENFPTSIKTICNLYTSCGECLRNPYCGWCQEQEKCMLGDNKGPRFDLCQFYTYETCKSNNCLKYLNCSSCLEDPFCGWCVDEDRNREGCIPGLDDFGSCPKWYYTTFTEKPQCPKPLKKEFFLEKEDINFENIPEEQRKVLLQREVEILQMDEKIDEVFKSLEGLDEKIAFYSKKYQDVSRKVDIEEINELREQINLRRINEEVKKKMKLEKDRILRKRKNKSNSTENVAQSNLVDQEKNQASEEENPQKTESEHVYTSLDLDDPKALKALS